MKHYILSLVFVCVVPSADATLIDSFFNRDQSDITFGGPDEGGHSIVASLNANCVGAERDFEFFQNENAISPGPRFVAQYDSAFGGLRIGGFANDTPGNGSSGRVILQYDGSGDEIGNTGRDKRLRNGGAGIPLFNGADGGIRVWYSQPYNDNSIPITATLRRQGSVIGTQTVGSHTLSSLSATSFAFAQNVFGIADSLTLLFPATLTGPNADRTLNLLYIDTIVPEPGTYLALGGGLVWLLRRRKGQSVRRESGSRQRVSGSGSPGAVS